MPVHRPSSTISAGDQWSASTGTVHGCIDDTAQDGDTTYAYVSAGIGTTLRVGLASAATPATGFGHALRYVARYNTASALTTGNAFQVQLETTSGVVIASGATNTLTSNYQQFTDLFDAVSISNYGALSVRITPTINGSNTLRLTQVEYWTPVGASGPAKNMMRQIASINRKTETASATTGATVDAWTIQSRTYCAIQGKASSESYSGQEAGTFVWAAYFPPGTDIVAGDRLEDVWSPEGATGQTFEVSGAPIDHAGRNAYVYVPLKELP